MNLELHIIQNFAPSNLNRDDTGSPKSCEFGGYRRARISSQAIKRAIRTQFRHAADMAGRVGERSKRLRREVAKLLPGRPESESENAFDAAVAILGFLSEERGGSADNDIRTEVLLFLSRAQIEALAEVCNRHWDELQKLHGELWPSGKGKKPSKDNARKLGSKALRGDVLQAIDASRSPDQALFGRMLADLPEKNIDAACQVAHAISTHQVNMDFDYYTAVDDLKPEETAGADMIGTVEFNSACFYRYANVDLAQLKTNLGGDDELARKTVKAFLEASRDAIPTGKQNSFAAQNPPSFAFAVVRESGFWSLANAFVKPVKPRGDEDIVQVSVDALAKHWSDLTALYGDPSKQLAVCALPSLTAPDPLAASKVATYAELVQRVMGAIEV